MQDVLGCREFKGDVDTPHSPVDQTWIPAPPPSGLLFLPRLQSDCAGKERAPRAARTCAPDVPAKLGRRGKRQQKATNKNIRGERGRSSRCSDSLLPRKTRGKKTGTSRNREREAEKWVRGVRFHPPSERASASAAATASDAAGMQRPAERPVTL